MEKINLAATLLGPAAERGTEIEKGGSGLHESRAGIPILANCFVGRLPKLCCEKRTEGRKGITCVPADLITLTLLAPMVPSDSSDHLLYIGVIVFRA